MVRNDLRNVAIIAHVDHGKTTLVDAMLRQSGAFRDNQVVAERVMDSGDIERERGITILAKNCSCTYKGVKINIVDTPGHADFGGEVERVLKMVNGVLLLVDAAEGCMPQTRFVLQKALQQNLSLVVAINKIDRPDARIKEVIDEVLYLLMDLGASDEQLECPILFCCGRQGTASLDPDVPGTDLIPLFDTLLDTIQPPQGDPEAPFQMLVSSVDYNEFVGRIGIGRIQNGVAKVGEEVVVCDWHNPDLKMRGRLTKLYDFQANGRQPCDNITAGDIVAFSGLPDVTIGNTLCAPSQVEPLPFVKINDPTVEMTFSVNDSPLAGREGKYVTSRQIRDRLQKELLKDVALKVEDSPTTDSFRVMGRGEMHLSILIETMRREGYELQVSPPHVLTKVIDGKTYNGVTGWFEVKVASVPEVTTELSEAAGGVLTLKGSYKLDRDLSVEPGFRYAATADGVASVQFVRATQVDEANKTFSLDIPDTGQPCFFQAVVRMSTDFYDGEVSEVIRPKDLSAAGVANCYIVTEGGWYSIEPKRPDGTAVQGSAADWVWSSGSGLVSGVHFSAGRIVFQTSGNAGNAGIALTNDAGEIVWSWHIWMAQAPAEQTVNGRTFLDRNVGATEFDGALVGSLGVYFQWGRKDPFIGANRIQKNYTDEYEGVGFQTTGDNGFTALFLYNDALCEGFKFVNKEMDMSMSIANPTVFYGVYNSGGWKGSNSEVEDYWGGASGTKTNNDPCPAGYRVPTFDEINGFIKDIDTNKTAQENVSDQSYGRKYTVGDQTFMFPGSALRVWSAKMRYPGRVTFFWSSTISPTTEKKALDFYDYRWNTNADNTCCAMAVRCIKIQ